MSTATNPYFETAKVRVVSQCPWVQSDFKLAYVLVSSRIYWKAVKKDGLHKPQSLHDFQNAESMELFRVVNGTWDDLQEYVTVDNYNGRRRISVWGRLDGRTRWNNASLYGNVRVEIVPNTSQQLEVWLNQIRARIAPWNLLQQEFKDLINRSSPSRLEDLYNALGRLVGTVVGTDCETTSTNWMNRKRRVLSVALCRIEVLQRDVLESLMEVMKPSHRVKEKEIDFVFKILEQTIRVMGVTETQLLRGRASRVMNSRGLKKIVKKVEELVTMGVIASNISRTCAINAKMNQLVEELEIQDIETGSEA